MWHAAAVRYIVYGAGAIGGVVGARLAENGHDVVLIARGGHGAAIRRDGLRIEAPAGSVVVRPAVVEHPGELSFGADDMVLLAVKGQDSVAALDALAGVASVELPVACLQNGVDNERVALVRFRTVLGVSVMCPAGHLEPGVVRAYSSPITGILDVGRYPSGTDATSEELAAAFRSSTFDAVARTDIMRWKWAKLLLNLGNAVEAVCGPPARAGRIGDLVREEGEAVLRAARIDFASGEEDRARRGTLLQVQPVEGQKRSGGSSWQSLERRTGSIETDHLNGEIVVLGRLHGVPVPVNERLQGLARQMAHDRAAPGRVSEDEFLTSLSI